VEEKGEVTDFGSDGNFARRKGFWLRRQELSERCREGGREVAKYLELILEERNRGVASIDVSAKESNERVVSSDPNSLCWRFRRFSLHTEHFRPLLHLI